MFSQEIVDKVVAMASDLGVEAADLLAIAEIESGGTVSWKVDGVELPPIRFEGHYFHRILTKRNTAKLARAVSAGLANPKAGGVMNPSSYKARYALLARAIEIDETAALESTSWGLGQVMGAHWEKLGFASPQELVALAKTGVDGQIEVMSRYVQAFGLVDELQSNDFLSFANQYNGPASQKNDYAGKIKRAYERWKKQLAGSLPSEDSDVAEWQAQLKRLGLYAGPVDGLAGKETARAVREFQAANGLVADGVVGKMTIDHLDAECAKLDVAKNNTVRNVGAGATAVGTVGTTLLEQAKGLQGLAFTDTLRYIVFGVMLVGGLLLAYGMWKGRKL